MVALCHRQETQHRKKHVIRNEPNSHFTNIGLFQFVEDRCRETDRPPRCRLEVQSYVACIFSMTR
jgi:hypothetical protein